MSRHNGLVVAVFTAVVATVAGMGLLAPHDSEAVDNAATSTSGEVSGSASGATSATPSASGPTVASASSPGSESSAASGSTQQSVTAATGFVHPGVLVSKGQLDFVKGKLAVGANPWAATIARFQTAKATDGQIFGSTSYVPHPVYTLDCLANNGCVALQDDGVSAYTHALNYYYSSATDRAKYATAAIKILNAWSSTLKGTNGNQSRLQTAFSAGMLAQAAEIIRYTYTPASGQPVLNVSALSTMFLNVLVPNIQAGDPYSNGNWELAMSFSMINMGVFMDNRTVFDRGVTLWRNRVPAYIYVSADGATPKLPPGGKYDDPAKLKCYWAGAGTPTTSCAIPNNFGYYPGMVQETCRDMSHVSLGLSGMMNAAETAYLQGVNLYAEQKDRIIAGYEFTARYDSQFLSTGSVPSWLCGGTFQDGGVGYKLGWEIAYNHHVNRVKLSMPYTKTFITNVVRPTAYKAGGLAAWQALTHAGS